MITFTVHGKPAPQGSKNVNRYGAVYESSKAVKPWREAVRAEAQRNVGIPLAGPVDVVLTFRLTRPAGHYRTGRNAGTLRDNAPAYPGGQKDDIDKLARAVLDGLTEGGAWKDDGQVVVLSVFKLYAAPDQAAGCTIKIMEI